MFSGVLKVCAVPAASVDLRASVIRGEDFRGEEKSGMGQLIRMIAMSLLSHSFWRCLQELKRTRINVICFKEGGLMEASGGGLTPPPHARPAPAPSQSRARPSSQTPNGWQPPLPAATSANQPTSTPPPGAGSNRTERNHRRTSSLSSQDSDISDVYRPGSRLPPRSPNHQAAMGYDGDGLDTYGRSTPSVYSMASSSRQPASSRTGWSSRRPTDAEDLT